MTAPDPSALAQLVRLPAVLSVPGDAWLGAAAARRGDGDAAPRLTLAMPAASALIYLGGMALNDWADRQQDAVERPERPIPSGRVSPGWALGVGAGLVAAGVGVAGAVGGAAALAVAGPLAGAVVLYDLAAKDTPVGPPVMAACRGLDVLLGAAGAAGPAGVASRVGRALPAAGLVAAHTATVTTVSQHEVHGAPPSVPAAAAALTGAIALATLRGVTNTRQPHLVTPPLSRSGAAAVARGGRSAAWLAPVAAAAGTYAWQVGGGYLRAARAGGDAAAVRQAVGGGVMGLIPLQAGLLAGAGAMVRAAVVAAAIPVGRVLRRRREVT